MSGLSSRERVLAAMRYEVPDHVPLLFRVFGFRPPARLAWSNQYEQAQRWLSLGVDATLRVHIPLKYHPAVRTRSWEETIPGERWPVMVKEYDTPGGTLRQEVYRTEDWESPDWPDHSGGEVRLLDDYNVVRSRRFLIETAQDLGRLRYLLHPLPDDEIDLVRRHAEEVAAQARQLGVAVECSVSDGADMATWLCGVDGMVMMAIDRPAMFEELMAIIDEHDRRNMEIALDLPVDEVVRRAWYEGTTFWSPALYRRFFMPGFKKLTAMAHQAGRLMGYIMTAGFMPLLDTLAEIGYDVHHYIDPVQGGPGSDLRKVKQVFDREISVRGGMNSSVVLEQGTRDDIRQAVFDAVRILGPDGGLILSPSCSINASTPWKSIETVIEAWKEVRDYPAQ